MTLLIAIRGWDENAWLARFKHFLPEQEVALAGSNVDPATVKYVACWKHEPGSLVAFSNVKALFSLGAGVDHLVSDQQLPSAPIVRMIDSDLTGRMTEWVVWQCLDWLRQGKTYRAQQIASQWIDDRNQPAAHDVSVGVMGLGVLGQDAIRALKSLRFNVAGWSRSLKTIDGVETFAGDDGLQQFLARTDILVVLCRSQMTRVESSTALCFPNFPAKADLAVLFSSTRGVVGCRLRQIFLRLWRGAH